VIVLFLAGACILGLILFAALVRADPAPGFFRTLGVGVALAVLVGLAILRILPHSGSDLGRVIFSLALLWLAWVGIMAFVAQLLRARFPQSTDWVLLSSGLATLAPATGLVLALWMV